MIELIPWMLILVWWDPSEPTRYEVQREARLFADEETCRLYGNERVATVKNQAQEFGGVQVRYSCMEVPDSWEYDRLFADIDAKRREGTGGAINPDDAPDPSAGQGQ